MSIDLLLTDAASNRPYALVPKDGPMSVKWNGDISDMSPAGTGRLNTVVGFDGNEFDALELSIRLFSSVNESISVLHISDLPSLLENF